MARFLISQTALYRLDYCSLFGRLSALIGDSGIYALIKTEDFASVTRRKFKRHKIKCHDTTLPASVQQHAAQLAEYLSQLLDQTVTPVPSASTPEADNSCLPELELFSALPHAQVLNSREYQALQKLKPPLIYQNYLSPFACTAFELLCQIPPQLVTYHELGLLTHQSARSSASSNVSRTEQTQERNPTCDQYLQCNYGQAVGRIMACNHLLLLLPCHLVVPNDPTRGIGNYQLGTAAKRYLLQRLGLVS